MEPVERRTSGNQNNWTLTNQNLCVFLLSLLGSRVSLKMLGVCLHLTPPHPQKTARRTTVAPALKALWRKTLMRTLQVSAHPQQAPLKTCLRTEPLIRFSLLNVIKGKIGCAYTTSLKRLEPEQLKQLKRDLCLSFFFWTSTHTAD